MNDLDQLMAWGGTFVFGGAIGFAMGYAIKKVLRVLIVIMGLIFALFAFAAYKGWIDVKWAKISHDMTGTFNSTAHQGIQALNSTAHNIANSNGNGADIAYPILGVIGFMPGFFVGLKMG